MKSLSQFLFEASDSKVAELEKKLEKVEKKAEDAEKAADDAEEAAADAEKEANKAEESIKNEEDFRDYAKNKFEEVFGDDLDEKQMKKTVDGLLKKYKEDTEKGDWGKIVGILNKSFGH